MFLCVNFSKVVLGFRNLDMIFEGLGEMFVGDSADTCGGKFPLVLMGASLPGLACADPEERIPISASKNLFTLYYRKLARQTPTQAISWPVDISMGRG